MGRGQAPAQQFRLILCAREWCARFGAISLASAFELRAPTRSMRGKCTAIYRVYARAGMRTAACILSCGMHTIIQSDAVPVDKRAAGANLYSASTAMRTIKARHQTEATARAHQGLTPRELFRLVKKVSRSERGGGAMTAPSRAGKGGPKFHTEAEGLEHAASYYADHFAPRIT
eukprot:SAG22_NODE_7113_length_774_cov_1.604444_1_plen_174_part_00